MRKIESLMLDAVRSGREMRRDNTSVEHERGRALVRLHGHLIGVVSPNGELTISNCGYETATTKSRLNALLRLLPGCHGIYQHRFQWFLDGEQWDGEPTTLKP